MITGIEFNGYTIPHGRIQKIDGLDSPPYRVSQSTYAAVRGGRFNAAYMDKRPVTIEFLVYCTSMDEYLEERAEIMDAFSIEDGEKELEIWINEDDNVVLNAVAMNVNAPTRAAPTTYVNVQVQLTAYDPVIYSSEVHVESGILAPSGGGAEFSLIFPITFESSSSGTVTLYNEGNIDSCPRLVFTGLLTNPLVRNVTTGESFQLNYTSGVNDEIVVDMAARTVVLNGSTNLLGSVVDNSDWFCLDPGANIISLSTGSTADTGQLEIIYQDAWSAV